MISNIMEFPLTFAASKGMKQDKSTHKLLCICTQSKAQEKLDIPDRKGWVHKERVTSSGTCISHQCDQCLEASQVRICTMNWHFSFLCTHPNWLLHNLVWMAPSAQKRPKTGKAGCIFLSVGQDWNLLLEASEPAAFSSLPPFTTQAPLLKQRLPQKQRNSSSRRFPSCFPHVNYCCRSLWLVWWQHWFN